jgi:hypothetical protein
MQEIGKLRSRDSAARIEHMKAIYQTIRVIGKGSNSRSAQKMSRLEQKDFSKLIEKRNRSKKKNRNLTHEQFIKLSLFLNEYKNKVCFDTVSMPRTSKMKNGQIV